MKIKLIVGILLVGLLVAGYFAATGSVKGRIEAALGQALQRKVTVTSVYFTLPPRIQVTGLKVASGPGEVRESLASVQQLGIGFSVLSLLKGKPGIDLELAHPKLRLVRTPEGLWAPSFSLRYPSAGAAVERAAQQPRILLSRLRLRDGELTLIDRKVAPEAVWLIRDLRVSLSSGPRIGGYTVSALGVLEDETGRSLGRFDVNGEILPKETAELKVSLSYDALQRLASYVRPILGTAPAKGSLALDSKVTLQGGAMIAENHLTATGLAFATDEPTVLGPAGNELVSMLQDPDGRIHINFVVKGRLGESLDWSDLLSSTLREAIRQALTRSIQRTLTDIESIKPFEELIQKGLESLGR